MEGFIHTDDEVRLRYTEYGSGRPVVFIHGWQGAAEQWRPAAQALSGDCRAVIYDQRGYGGDLGLPGTVRPARLERLVFVDQAPAMVSDPVWDQLTVAGAGAIFTDADLHAVCHSLADPESREDTVRAIVAATVTPAAPPELTERVVAWALRVDGSYAAELLRNHAHQDWRRQIGLITLPTLVVAGRASVVPCTAAEWIAHKIPGAQLEIFEPDEGGSHLLALENPAKFNLLLREFLAGALNPTEDRPSPSTHQHPTNARGATR